jgi:hypothetical protein
MVVYHLPSRNFLYAKINDAETGELMVNATIEYCVDVVAQRNYLVVQ